MIIRGNTGGVFSGKLLQGCLQEHMRHAEKMHALHDLYAGRGQILQRTRPEGLPNNRLCHGFGRYIVTVSASYLAGGGVTYHSTREGGDPALDGVMRAYKMNSMDSVDMELARHASLYGKGVELIYADENTCIRSCALDPRSAFVVYDDTVAHRPLFGVNLYPVQGESGVCVGWAADVYTRQECLHFQHADVGRLMLEGPRRTEKHYFGQVPMIEYWNSDEEESDLENVRTLIEAYDVLESDRVNDREQQVDALLLLYGAQLSVDDRGRTPAQQLRQDKLLYLPDRDAGAEYLCPGQTGADAESLRLALERDIHKFSMVPDLSDEHFAGNVSGVAIKYKLLGLEQLTRMKERYFREALRERLRIYAHFLAVKGAREMDAAQVNMVFRRTLPVDMLETAQMVKTLSGMVEKDVLVSQLPFVEGT